MQEKSAQDDDGLRAKLEILERKIADAKAKVAAKKEARAAYGASRVESQGGRTVEELQEEWKALFYKLSSRTPEEGKRYEFLGNLFEVRRFHGLDLYARMAVKELKKLEDEFDMLVGARDKSPPGLLDRLCSTLSFGLLSWNSEPSAPPPVAPFKRR